MVQVKDLEKLEQTLQRVFALKVSRSTYREVQNAAVAATGGDKEQAQQIFNSLMTGESQQGELDEETYSQLQKIVAQYSVPTRLARDVSEKGEFINLVTSDTLRQGDLFAFLNRIRRIDGDEFQFITDLDSTMHLLLHFGSRLQELRSIEGGPQLLASKAQALSVVQNQIGALLAAATSAQGTTEASDSDEGAQ